MKRTMIWLAVAIITLMFSLWQWLLPWWAEQLLADRLSEHGLVLEEVAFTHIGLHYSEVQRIQFQHPSQNITGQLSGLQLHYQPLLILRGELEHMRIQLETLNVHVKKSNTPTTSGIVLLSPLPMLTMIPVAELHIQMIHVQQHQQGNVDRHWSGQMSYIAKQLRVNIKERKSPRFAGLDASITLDHQWNIAASLKHQNKTIYRLRGKLTEQHDTILLKAEVDLQLASAHAALRAWAMSDLPETTGKLHTEIQLRIPKNRPMQPNELLQQSQLTVQLQLQAKSKVKNINIKGDLHIHAQLNQGQGTWRVLPKSTLRLHENAWSVDVHKHQLQGTFKFQKNNSVYVAINEKSVLELHSLRWQEMQMDTLQLRAMAPIILGAKNGRSSPIIIKLTPSTLHWNDYQFKTDIAQLELFHSRRSSDLSGLIELSNFSLRSKDLHLPRGNMSLKFQRQKKLLQAVVKYQLSPLHTWMFDLKVEPDTLQGRLGFALALSKPEATLKQMLPITRSYFKDLSLPTGEITATGEVELGAKGLQTRATLRLHQLQGQYKENVFQQLQGEFQLEGNQQKIEVSYASISLAKLHAGIPLHEITFYGNAMHRFGGDLQLNLQDLELHLLGGKVSAKEIRLNTSLLSSKRGNPFTLKLEGVKIDEIVRLEKQQGLKATGLVDGLLPFNWRQEGLFMTNGTLFARKPGGLIQYIGSEAAQNMAKENYGVDLAFQVLNNFNYHQLKADLNYQPDGKLLLALHLKGKNPSYDAGRPIEFNVNVEENVLMLLKSLHLADGIQEKIQQRLE